MRTAPDRVPGARREPAPDSPSRRHEREAVPRLHPPEMPGPRTYPLSYGQERIWLDQQVNAESNLHHLVASGRVEGPLSVSLLERSLALLVGRHDALRTCIVLDGDRPVQVVSPELPVPLTVVDLHDVAPDRRFAEAQRRTRDEARRPFDLAHGPLMRATLFCLGDADHLLVLTFHHIVMDGVAMRIVSDELWECYGALAAGRAPALRPLPIQFGDFAAWQRARFAGDEGARQAAYWAGALGEDLPELELPTDRPRGPAPTASCGRRDFEIPTETRAALQSLARAEGATPFMALLAAFQGLLGLYSDQDEVLVGFPVSGRDRPETAPVIGFLLNMLLLRTDLRGAPTFRELLGRVREGCRGAYEHREYPTEKLLETLEWRRDVHGGGRLPLRALFNMPEGPPAEPWRVAGLTATPSEVLFSEEADFDLHVHVRRRGTGYHVIALYREDLFDAATIDTLIGDYVALLAAAGAGPDRPLAVLGPSEEARHRLRLKRYRAHRAASLDRLDDLARLSNLTRRQLLVWVGQKLRPGSPVYHLVTLITVDGAVDAARFGEAVQAFVDGGDTLRTVIEEADGIPQQRVRPPFPYAPVVHDVSAAADPDAALDAWVVELSQRPFDLTDRLFDMALVRLGPARHAVAIVQHHIVTDGWSSRLMGLELVDLYEQALAGRRPVAAPRPAFQAWAEHERAYRLSARHARDRDYWAAKLADPPDPLLLYGERGAKESTRAVRLTCSLGPERSRRLRERAAQDGGDPGRLHMALFSLFAAAMCAFLHRVSGARRICFVTDVHNRRSRAFKETFGLFVELVPVRVDVDEGATLESLVQQVRREMQDVLRHAQYAVSYSVHRADVELNYHTISNDGGRTMAGAPVTSRVVHTGHQEESLQVRILDLDNAGTFSLEMDLHCDVFPEDRRPLVVEHFVNALDALLDDPSTAVGRLSVIGAAERRRVVTELNRTAVDLPLERTFADLWDAQVSRTPDRVAAVGDGGSWTYRELDGRANAIARRLRALGVGPDVLAAVCLERSLDTLAALLAVAKAGGAWVPLDPRYPAERLAGILRDSRAPALISRRSLLAELPELARAAGDGGHVIDLDGAAAHESAATGPPGGAGPRHLAYAIYTSGSTGAPKGAMVEGRGMLNHLFAKVRDLGLTAEDTVAQTAPLAFDISVWQCFAALLVGGRVLVLPDAVAQDPRRLLAAVEAGGVSVLEVVPSLLGALNEELADAGAARPALRALRWLIATGEELAPALCHQWLSMYPAVPMMNAYGPTECSDDVTHHVIALPPHGGRERVPVGRPVANTRLYVLDAGLQPVPLGVSGELCVGGVGVGRGYLHDPVRTAEAFVPDPFATKPGSRLYRTGDRARFLPDGALEFLGRLDHQVKIRGHRIEPGEIESALGRHPSVRACVVAPRPDDRGQPRLVAYVVAADGQGVDSAELREFLRRRLPEPMVPAAIVAMAALPLTPNGKVDRGALPDPGRGSGESVGRFVAPRSETERRLVAIWEAVFGVRPIGVTESFFDLGGHSLMAVRLVARIKAAFGREVPLAALLAEPTIEALARRLERRTPAAAWSPLVPIQPAGARLPLFCVHAGGGSVMGYHPLARHLGPDQPLFGLEARGLDDDAVELSTDVADMARHYVAAVREERPHGPYALGGHSFGGIVAFEMARQLLAAGETVALLALIDAWRAPGSGAPTAEDRAMLASGFAHDLGVSIDHMRVSWDHMWSLPPADQVGYALDVALSQRLLPPEVSVAQVRRYLQLHVTHIEAMRRYTPAPIACPIALIRASEAVSLAPRDPALGWDELTTAGLQVLPVPGNHFTILREPHVQIVAERLRACLDAVAGARPAA